MNISLTSELENYVREQVASGQYKSASEVMREALRGHIRGTHVRGGMEDRLEARLLASRAQYAKGEGVSADDAFFDQKIKAVKEKYSA